MRETGGGGGGARTRRPIPGSEERSKARNYAADQRTPRTAHRIERSGGGRERPGPGGMSLQGTVGGAARGLAGLARGATDLTERVGQVTAEVAEYARNRALDLALEANGLVGDPAQERAAGAYGDLLEQVRRAAGNPLLEGPMRRLANSRAGGIGAQLRPAPEAGGSKVAPLPNAPRGGGASMQPLPPAPLGGPSVVRPINAKRGIGY